MFKTVAAMICCTMSISLLSFSNHWNGRDGKVSGSYQTQPNSQWVRCNACGASFYRNTSHTCTTCARCGKVHNGNCR